MWPHRLRHDRQPEILMRLWSIHPRYLDAKGLVALWREGLLAQHVLLGLTKGYRQHPQLIRFRAVVEPVSAIGFYLAAVANEADRRGYHFDRSKIARIGTCPEIEVGQGQLDYEWAHLLAKLKARAHEEYEKCGTISSPEAHPAFRVTTGGIAHWERT
jgi:hypothetical protein